MKISIIILLLFIPLLTEAQVLRLKEYICNNGYKIKKKDSVLIGAGSLQNGDYKYIVAYPRTLKNNYLPANSVGSKYCVKRMYKDLLTKKVIVFLSIEKKVVYACEIENAISAKEIVPPEHFHNYRLHPYMDPILLKGKIATKLNKNETFERVEKWFNGSFHDSLCAITKMDKGDGVFSGVSLYYFQSKVTDGNGNTKGHIQYTINLKIEDGLVNYEIGDFVHVALPDNQDPIHFRELTYDVECPKDRRSERFGRRWSQKLWVELKQTSVKRSEMVIESLKKTLTEN